MYPETVEMCEKRDQIPKRDLSLFEDHDSEEEEGRERGRRGRRTKGHLKGCRQWLPEGGSIILNDICFL